MCRKSLALSFAISLLLLSPLCFAQSSSESGQTMPSESLLEIGTSLVSDSQTLVQGLETRKLEAQKQIDYWQTIEAQLKLALEHEKQNSAELSTKLVSVQVELMKLRADLKAILASLDASKKSLVSLQKDFDNYKRSKSAELWITRGVAGVSILLLVASAVFK